MLKAVIWDNDGVLVDTEELYFKATREVLSEIGVDLTAELFNRISFNAGPKHILSCGRARIEGGGYRPAARRQEPAVQRPAAKRGSRAGRG